MKKSEQAFSFWEHVDHLRKAILLSVLAIGLGWILCLGLRAPLFKLLTAPLNKASASLQQEELHYVRYKNSTSSPLDLPSSVQVASQTEKLSPGEEITIEKQIPHSHLYAFGPLEGFSIILKMCFWVSLLVTSPFWAYFFLQFALPALRERERSLIIPFFLSSFICLSFGLTFAYFVTIPFTNNYFSLFNETMGQNLWSLSNYMSYTLFLLLANGLACELSLLFFFAVHYGFVSSQFLRKQRRPLIVLIFLVSAILTPPDVFSQLLLAIPLWIFSEGIILYARVREKRRDRKSLTAPS